MIRSWKLGAAALLTASFFVGSATPIALNESAAYAAKDVQAPTLDSYSVTTPQGTSLADNDVVVDISVKISDATGTRAPVLSVSHDSGQSHGFGTMSLTSGTIQKGTWTKSVVIPSSAAEGTWDVTLFPLTDTMGNSNGSNFRTLKFLNLTGTPTDSSAPVLSSYSVSPSSHNFSEGPVQITVQATVKDESGAEAPIVSASHSSGQSHGFGPMRLVKGTTKNGVWEQIITIPTTAATGTWTVSLFPLRDTMGNSRGSFFTDLGNVTITEFPDVQPGTLTIAGKAQVGNSLTASAGTWSPSNASLKYQWLANGTPLKNKTTATLALTPDLTGKNVSVQVEGKRYGYNTATAVSKSVKVVEGVSTAGTILLSSPHVLGQPITALTSEWAEGTVFTYQWFRDGSKIKGATQASYTPTARDVGSALRVDVTGKRVGYKTVTASSPSTSTIPLASQNAGTVTISGTAQVGQTLRGSASGWESNANVSYQWLRNGSPISQATGSSYALVAEDLGARISLDVTAALDGHHDASRTSKATSSVKVGTFTLGSTSVSGNAAVGSVLTARASKTPADTTLIYQWLREGKAIKGATKATYSLTPSDFNRKLSVTISGKYPGYQSVPVTTKPVSVSAGKSTPGKASFTGTRTVGKTLTAKPNGWASGTTYTYQWLRNGKNITGATKPTYKLTNADANKKISLKITGKRTGYTTTSKTTGAYTVKK